MAHDVVDISKLTDLDSRLAKLARGPFGPDVQSAEDLFKAMAGNTNLQERLGITRNNLVTRMKENPVLLEFMVQEANAHRKAQGGQSFAINPDELRIAAENEPTAPVRKKPLAEQIIDAAREAGKENPHIGPKKLMDEIVSRLRDADPDITQGQILNAINEDKQLIPKIKEAANSQTLLPSEIAVELESRLRRDPLRQRSDAGVASAFAAAPLKINAEASLSVATADSELEHTGAIGGGSWRDLQGNLVVNPYLAHLLPLAQQSEPYARPPVPKPEGPASVIPSTSVDALLAANLPEIDSTYVGIKRLNPDAMQSPTAGIAAAGVPRPPAVDRGPADAFAPSPNRGDRVVLSEVPTMAPNYIAPRGDMTAPQAKPEMDPKVQEMLGKALQAMGMNVDPKEPASLEPALRVACHRAGVDFDKLNIGTEPANKDTQKLMCHMNDQIIANAQCKEKVQALATVASLASFEGGAPNVPDVRSAAARSSGASRG